MDMGKSTAERIAGWFDLASMVLLGLALMAGSLTPRRTVWGRSWKRIAAITITMLALIIWTGFRFVYEGINTTAPREFLAGSVVYLARWCYLMLRISWYIFKEARMFRVARALRKVHNLRIGPGTDGPKKSEDHSDKNAEQESEDHNDENAQLESQNHNDENAHLESQDHSDENAPLESQDHNDEKTSRRNYGHIYDTNTKRIRNRDEWEVVLRKGVQKVTDKTRPYWRGFMVPEPVWHSDKKSWDVILLEEGMHGDKLDIFGTIDFMKDEDITRKAYGIFYSLVLTAMATVSATSTTAQQPSPTNASSATQQPQVHFTKFTRKWSPLKAEFIANQAGATDNRPIGSIARRIAADAVAYVNNHKKFRTKLQVASLNECLEDARKAQF